MIIHSLKCVQPYYDDVATGRKNFEVRRDDRGFEVGHWLDLYEWTGSDTTGERVLREITYLLRDAADFGLQPGFVVLGLRAS